MKTTMNLFAAGMFLAAFSTAYAQTTFTKITTGQVVTDGGSSVDGAWADYDGDGNLDLFVSNGTYGGDPEKNFLYRNNGDGTFTKVTTGDIVTEDVDSKVGAWGDYDNDGFPDLFVRNGASGNDLFYRNNGDGSFTKITTGPVVDDGQIAGGGGYWADFDNDGYLDLYVTMFQGSPPVNRLYRNNGDGTFNRVADNPAISDSGDWTGAAWADYDNDGNIDLFVCRWGENNALYRNNGHGSLTGISAGSIVNDGGSSIDCSWVDYDNDGLFDLFVTNGGADIAFSAVNFLYHNNGDGTFTKNTSDIITSDFGAWGACAWGDYDNDGFIDLFVANQVTTNALYHNNGDGTFTKITTGSPVNESANSFGCSWADYDNDGFLDLFVANGWSGNGVSQNNFLYRNDGNSNAWLKVKLVGTQSNRSGIGAKVRVTANIRGNSIRQLRQISGGPGGQSTLLAHFGLGDATNIDTVRIEWPSGIVQELRNVAPKQFLTITEPPHLQVTGRGEFQFKSWSGMRFTVEASPTLTGWTPLATVTNTTGTVRFLDPDAANYQQRFYRVRPVVP